MKTNTQKLPKTQKELEAIIQPYESRIEYLEERLKTLEKLIFAPKSEKRKPDDDEGGSQLHLFNEAECLADKKEEKGVTVPEHTRNKPKRAHLPENLPRIEIVHEIEESQKVCACGAELTKMGEEISEKLDIIPAKLQVIRHIRPKYACKNCEGVESEGPAVLIAPPPPEIIPQGNGKCRTSCPCGGLKVRRCASALPSGKDV